MKILLVHNYYQRRGGEDVVFEREAKLLAEAGHDVIPFTVTNDQLQDPRELLKITMALGRNKATALKMRNILVSEQPDIVHVHNTFPIISASIFAPCDEHSIPVVQTLHNFRMFCANGILLRDDKACCDCVGKVPFGAVRYRCYKKSTLGSMVVAAEIYRNSLSKVFQRQVSTFIVLTHMAKDFFAKNGLAPEDIIVKPHFAPQPARAPNPFGPRKGFVFVGRLSREKGVFDLIKAFQGTKLCLTIIGDGPERAALESEAGANINFAGRMSQEEISRVMQASQALIVPSVWEEIFGLVVVEAYANALPVIASKIGALAEIVRPETGYHFEAGDPMELRQICERLAGNLRETAKRGEAALRIFEELYSPEANLRQLEGIYQHTIMKKKNKTAQSLQGDPKSVKGFIPQIQHTE